ncbi:6-phosphogluconolactonase [Vulcanimicrobium alpinum]|uniref:6-phosphogluconolactonase n=1 Tax=Vulcanimicrobium alpinum TaxID=3016050 RepID=A0AAN1XXK5_UNVUL|nr:6-phosphogluconolactonase [Vulcanimicrobium alpinum]BDE06112.1 6-phosphogluconolactonase [Vulcanimicrobium alpinum]
MAGLRNVTVLPDAGALATAAADHAVAVLQRTLAARERAHLALAGGSTPRAMNALLAAPPRRDALDWTRVVFWFGDERCVPPSDADSNYRMNRETLLDPLAVAPGRVHRMRGEDDPTAAAADYHAVLQRELGERPRLDLILLGMGPDGHTASLFPGTVSGIARSALCIAHFVPRLDRWRITLTPHAINDAHSVTITAGGAEKADALAMVLNGPPQPDVYPSQIVRPRSGDLHWFVDAAAAAKL